MTACRVRLLKFPIAELIEYNLRRLPGQFVPTGQVGSDSDGEFVIGVLLGAAVGLILGTKDGLIVGK